MSENLNAIAARGVTFAYRGGKQVLGGVDLSAAAGTLLCLLGPNGSGKTTLLRCLMGRLTPSSGQILLDGKPLGRRSARQLARLMAYVPQFPQAAFAFTTEQIVLMGRLAHGGALGLASRQDRAVAHQAMIMTQTLEFAQRTLEELSGGEAQRVMIARALAQQPGVMLLDEPTSHLDIKNQLLIYQMMRRLAHEWGMAVVCVSHDVNLAARYADQLVLMRDGAIIAAGTPAQVVQPDLLEQTYDVPVQLLPAPDGQVPLIWAG